VGFEVKFHPFLTLALVEGEGAPKADLDTVANSEMPAPYSGINCSHLATYFTTELSKYQQLGQHCLKGISFDDCDEDGPFCIVTGNYLMNSATVSLSVGAVLWVYPYTGSCP
jgi:hypothetical protein